MQSSNAFNTLKNAYKAKEYNIGNTKIYPLFVPDHNPELIIVNAILKAQNSIHIAIFTFSGSTTIDDAHSYRLVIII